MADLTVEVRVSSQNQQILVANQLVLVKSGSTTTGWDIINQVSQQQKGRGSLLLHILTWIAIQQSDERGDDSKLTKSRKSPYIQALASSSLADDNGTTIPLQHKLYPLLQRHHWTKISFLICDELTVQSQVFLSHIQGDSKSVSGTADHSNYANPFADFNGDDENEGLDSKQRVFHHQRFFNRSSHFAAFASLTEITSLYHIFAAVLLIFLTGILTNEALEKGALYRFDLLLWNFGGLDKV